MAISTAMCTSFKVELLKGIHDFSVAGDVFKIAMYLSTSTLDATVTAYGGPTNETTGTNYTAGGNTLTNVTPIADGTTAICDFADSVWSNATVTARGALIYNSSNSNVAVVTLDFGSDKTSTAGDFTIQFPAAAAATAIIRIA